MKELNVYTRKISKISQYDIMDNHCIKKSHLVNKTCSRRSEYSFDFITEDEYNKNIISSRNVIKHYIGVVNKDIDSMIDQKCKLIIRSCDFLGVREYWNRLRIYEIEKEQVVKSKKVIEKYKLQKYEIYIGVSGKNSRGKGVRVNRRISGNLDELKDVDKLIFYLTYSAVRELKKRYFEKSVQEGVYDCVFLPEVSSLLIHEYVGHLSEKDIWERQKEYPIGHKFGKSIDVYDVGTYENNELLPCPIWIDDDGCTCQKVHIIKDGILQELLSQIDEDNKVSSGNSRIGLKGKRQIRMRNTFLKEGKTPLCRIIDNIEHGYIFTGAFIGTMSEEKGVEVLLHMGFEINNGCITDAIEMMYISDSVEDFINNISEIGTKVEWFGNVCCKKGEMIYVGMGAPAIKSRVKLKKASILDKR